MPGAIEEPDMEGMSPMMSVLKEMVNFKILSQPLFLLIAISNVFGMLGFYVPFVYLPNMAVLQGISVESANFLLSVIGISNTFGNFFINFEYFVPPLSTLNLFNRKLGVCAGPFTFLVLLSVFVDKGLISILTTYFQNLMFSQIVTQENE